MPSGRSRGPYKKTKNKVAVSTIQKAGRAYLARKRLGKYGTGNRPVNIFRNPTTMQEGALPFNSQGLFRLPFAENFAISADGTLGTSVVTYAYSGNGPYDPRIQIGGGQPIQWDDISPLYERYWVHYCKVSVIFSNPTHDGMVCGVRVRTNVNSVATTGRTIDELAEMDLCKQKRINNSGKQVTSFNFTLKPYQIIGITKGQYNNLEYSGLVASSNPAVQPYIEPYACHTVAGETGVIRCYVKVTYYIQMTNKITSLDA